MKTLGMRVRRAAFLVIIKKEVNRSRRVALLALGSRPIFRGLTCVQITGAARPACEQDLQFWWIPRKSRGDCFLDNQGMFWIWFAITVGVFVLMRIH